MNKVATIPVEPSDEVIRQMLEVIRPATYRQHLRYPNAGPKTSAQTEKDIAQAVKQYAVIVGQASKHQLVKEHVAEVRGQKSTQHPEHVCKYIVPLLDLPEGTKLFLSFDQDAVEKYWKPEVSKLSAEITALNKRLAQPDLPATNGGHAVAWFFRHDLDTGNGWIDNYRALSDERPDPASKHMVNVHEIVPLCYKGDFDKIKSELDSLRRWEEMVRENSPLVNRLSNLEAKLNKALEALTKIAAIEDEQWGANWDEIKEARYIANETLIELKGEQA